MNANHVKVAASGAIVTSALVAFIATWEGKVNTVRIDPISGVYDVCYGHTGQHAMPGKTYTDEQCADILREDINIHQAGVRACIQSPVNQNQLDAFTSLAFNIGIYGACQSSAMTLLNEGKFIEACHALMDHRGAYRRDRDGNRIPGSWREVKGLKNRREAERIWCLTPSQGPRGASLYEMLRKSL